MTDALERQDDAECWVCKSRFIYATTPTRTIGDKVSHRDLTGCIVAMTGERGELRIELDAAKQRIAELGVELRGQRWRAENFLGCFRQQEDRAKAAEAKAATAYRAGYLECQRQAVALAQNYEVTLDGDDPFGNLQIAQAISLLKPTEGDNAGN